MSDDVTEATQVHNLHCLAFSVLLLAQGEINNIILDVSRRFWATEVLTLGPSSRLISCRPLLITSSCVGLKIGPGWTTARHSSSDKVRHTFLYASDLAVFEPKTLCYIVCAPRNYCGRIITFTQTCLDNLSVIYVTLVNFY